MIRKALLKETPDTDPYAVICHGFFTITEVQKISGVGDVPDEIFNVHGTIALIEDSDGLLKEVPIEAVKLYPPTIDLAKLRKSEIILPK